ncbi:MAG: hypothetical protein ACFFDN_15530 [Candidatus Hodarchaeota archaeon]
MNNYLLYLTKLRISSYNLCNYLKCFPDNCKALFLDFPTDLEGSIEKYFYREISVKKLWNYFQELTDLKEPYINALKYAMNPILEYLPDFLDKVSNLKLYCYQDLYFFKNNMDLNEKYLLLTYRVKATNKIEIPEWRNLLYDEVETGKAYYLKNLSYILRNLNENGGNIIIFRNFIKKLRDELLRIKKSKLKTIYLMNYWRSPLEYLLFQVFLKNKVSDNLIKICVKEHVRYIDFILTSNSLDDAHLKWSKSKFKFNIYSNKLIRHKKCSGI